jgi:hypothetical protein
VSGRIVHIGDATLILGDCRDWIPTLFPVDAVISDPPYGVKARAGMGGGSKGDGGMWAGATIAGDVDVSIRDQALLLAAAPFAVIAAVRLLHPAGTQATVVWDKGEHTGAGDLRMPWKPNFDLVHIGGDGWAWHRRGSGIVKFNAVAGCVADRNDGKRFHPFEKPCSLMAHFIQRAPGKRILDPFMGSGTTGVAAVRCGAQFIGIEIEEKYFSIACRRIEDANRQKDLFVAPPASALTAEQGGLL